MKRSAMVLSFLLLLTVGSVGTDSSAAPGGKVVPVIVSSPYMIDANGVILGPVDVAGSLVMLKVNDQTIPVRVDWNWSVGGADFVTASILYYGYPDCAGQPAVPVSDYYFAVGANMVVVVFPMSTGNYMLGLVRVDPDRLGSIYTSLISYRDASGCVTPASPIQLDPPLLLSSPDFIVTISARPPFSLKH